MIGTKLAHYEITSHIGSGGMGDVYQATDAKLGRSVAIKFLPDAFSHDTERVARFQREARVLASLNHSNIAAIYGLEEIDKRHFLVMELVPGETLADRVKRGAIPLSEAIPVARQIADALEAAHEQGIIHRDLKPANVKVREDGTVKVLDFGLAKALEPAGTTPSASQSPTVTSPAMTQAGIILGTAAYMSPEQAKGRAADKRSDVWSFGCVLYEMLTGKRAFDGEDVSDTLAAVLRGDPDWTALPRETPPSIVTLLKRCLERDRRRRIGDIAAAQFVLGEQVNPVQEVQQQRRLKHALLAAVALAAVVFGGIGVWILKPDKVTTLPLVRFSFSLGEGERFPGSGRQIVAISPDGTQIVYAANNRLYRRSMDDLASHAIPGTELPVADLGTTITSPVFSPDGNSIAFFSSGAIKRIPLSGGSPATISPATNPRGMSWSERGIVFAGEDGKIFLVSPNGGKPEELVSLKNGEVVYGPQILPGGDSLLFTVAQGAFRAGMWDQAQVVVQSLTTGTRKIIVEGGSDGRYLPSGQLIYALSGTLYAVGFNPRTQTTNGERIPVLSGVRRTFIRADNGAAQWSISATGTLAYIPGPLDARSTQSPKLVLSDRNGKIATLKAPLRNYVHPRVSRDGSRLAVGTEEGQDVNIWIYDLAETSTIRKLTLKGRNRYPVWSPDGQRVAFQSDAMGDAGIFLQRADGIGVAERLTTPTKEVSHIPESWSPDGKYLLFAEQRDQRSYVLYRFSMDDKMSEPFGNVTSPEPIGATFSPDGKWVAYGSGGRASPDSGIFIQPFPATGTVYQVPKVRLEGRSYHPVWAPDGKTLFFVPGSAFPLAAVSVSTQPVVTFGSPVGLSETVPRPGLLSTDVRGYDLLPDGRILTLVSAADQDTAGGTATSEVRVVLNWVEELKRLVR